MQKTEQQSREGDREAAAENGGVDPKPVGSKQQQGRGARPNRQILQRHALKSRA